MKRAERKKSSERKTYERKHLVHIYDKIPLNVTDFKHHERLKQDNSLRNSWTTGD